MIKPLLFMVALATISTAALAVPTLQVGVPDGSGGYVAYTPILTDPTETSTAVFSGNTLSVAAAFGPNDVEIGSSSVSSWSSFQFPEFTGRGAVLMATVPGGVTGDVTIDGMSHFFEILTFSDLNKDGRFPNDHDPLKEIGGADRTYLFFDLGDFSKFTDAVPNFADPSESKKDGEVKNLDLKVDGFAWVHFDLLALVTTDRDQVSLDINPPSHDVTWKTDGGGPPTDIPEPGTLLLLGSALAALGLRRRLRS